MKRLVALLIGVGFGLVAPAVVSAETAYTRKDINLRAGPSRDYPSVTRIPDGVPVDVAGCVDDWTWCDVMVGEDRGWVYAGNLEFPYQGRRVVVLDNGPMIGFPIVSFAVGPYWDNYYRSRPWYSRRSYWSQRPAPDRWIGIGRPRTSVIRPGSPRPGGPVVIQPSGPRLRPDGRHPVEVRPAGPRPGVVRPGARPEVARPPQPARPAPVRPQEQKRGRERGDGRGPGGG